MTNTHHRPVQLKDVKVGDYVRLKESERAPVWIRGSYDRASRSFSLESHMDIGREIFRKGAVLVWVDFTF
jgi:hypothetical protein